MNQCNRTITSISRIKDRCDNWFQLLPNVFLENQLVLPIRSHTQHKIKIERDPLKPNLRCNIIAKYLTKDNYPMIHLQTPDNKARIYIFRFNPVKIQVMKRNITSIIIWHMKTGSAARCLRVLSPATIIKFRSIWWIFRSQFIVPSTNQEYKSAS
jgi:hypothetical protein